MRTYRFYFLDRLHHVRRTAEVCCRDEEEAVDLAASLDRRCPVEVRDGETFIHLVEPSRM